MDLYSYLLNALVLFVSFSLITFIYRSKPNKSNLPPGRRGWPVIGETWAFVMDGLRGTPEKFLTDRMTKYSPDVFQTSLLGDRLAVFCGASGNKFLFSNENKYVTTYTLRSFKMVLQFPETLPDKMRKFLPEFLKPEALQNYIPIMDSIAKEHLETDWSPYEDVKVLPLVKKYAFALTCRLLMSVKDPKSINKFEDPFNLVTTGLKSMPINLPGTALNQAIRGGKVLREEVLKIIRKRKLDLSDNKEREVTDMLSRMLLSSDDDESSVFNDVEIACIITSLLIASNTTSSPITSMMNYLAQYPNIYQGVFEEQMEIARSKGEGELLNWKDIQKMKYTWSVACEVLRLAPPQGQFRQALTDFSFAGFTIPKGWKIYWTPHSTHKNPKYFPDPEKFDPSRFEGRGPAPYTFVPFGGGPRMCPGKEYARLAILSFMHNAVTKFKWEKTIPNEKIKYDPAPTPEYGLPIRLFINKN